MKYLTKRELHQLLKTKTPEQILYQYMKGSIKLKSDQIDYLIDLKKNKEVS